LIIGVKVKVDRVENTYLGGNKGKGSVYYTT